MSEPWQQTITDTGLDTGFARYRGPEGAEHDVLPATS